MSNVPNKLGHWEFVIKRTPTGKGTRALFEDIRIGSEIVADGPFGLAHLRSESPRGIVCVGGGSGLSPLLSILRSTLENSKALSKEVHFFYGAKRAADNCIDALFQSDPLLSGKIKPVVCLSDATDDDDWTGERGFVHESLNRWLQSGRDASLYDYYFCGPPPMTAAVQTLLFDQKVPIDHLYFDRFF